MYKTSSVHGKYKWFRQSSCCTNGEFAQIAEIMSISHMMQYTNCGLPHSDIRMHVRVDHMPP